VLCVCVCVCATQQPNTVNQLTNSICIATVCVCMCACARVCGVVEVV